MPTRRARRLTAAAVLAGLMTPGVAAAATSPAATTVDVHWHVIRDDATTDPAPSAQNLPVYGYSGAIGSDTIAIP